MQSEYTAPSKSHRAAQQGLQSPSVLLHRDTDPSLGHQNKMMCPGRDTNISAEGITPCMAQSTWGMQRNTSYTPQNEEEVENLQSTQESSFCQCVHKCLLNVKRSERPAV